MCTMYTNIKDFSKLRKIFANILDRGHIYGSMEVSHGTDKLLFNTQL